MTTIHFCQHFGAGQPFGALCGRILTHPLLTPVPSLIIILLLSGCATVPEDPWEGLTVDVKPAATSVDCGGFPLPSETINDAIVYDNAGVNDLDAYRTCSEANQAIVDEHSKQIAELKVARKALVEAGRAQRNIAVMRQEMLEDERQHNFWTQIGYWIVIVGLGVAASD